MLHRRDWLVDPGVEIPTEATAVHGITTEQARELGMDPARAVVPRSSRSCAACSTAASRVVVYNAPYDLTLLDREAAPLRRRAAGLARPRSSTRS